MTTCLYSLLHRVVPDQVPSLVLPVHAGLVPRLLLTHNAVTRVGLPVEVKLRRTRFSICQHKIS